MSDPTTPGAYTWGTWPYSQIERDLRAENTTLRDGLTACIAYAATHGGLCPIGQLRTLLKEAS